MIRFGASKIAAISIIGIGAFAASSPALAGRCGHSYPVDSATTLSEVARQCNVSVAALREANPGVNPGNVRPGEHLAVPDEIDRFAINDAVTSSSASATVVVTQSSSNSPSYLTAIQDDDGLAGSARIDNLRGSSARSAQRIRVRNHRSYAARNVVDAPAATRVRYQSSEDRLSFQQLSKFRIHNAGIPTVLPQINFGSANTISKPDTQLIECPVLLQNDGGKIRKVRKIISATDSTFVEIDSSPDGDVYSCTLISADAVPLTPGVPAARYGAPTLSTGYRVPDYNKIGLRPAPQINRISAPTGPQSLTLRGLVVDSFDRCLMLRADDGSIWRLTSAQPAHELVGKQITAWGAIAQGGPCGDGQSLSVSHAVYAEPWRAN